MPTYVYTVINKDGSDGERFEVVQKMTDPPLTRHPETGRPVRRVILAPYVAGKYTERATARTLGNDNLARHGFTKYEKTGHGTYAKAFGSGPDRLGE